MSTFDRRHHEEYFCEIILNFDQEEISFKDIYIYIYTPQNN